MTFKDFLAALSPFKARVEKVPAEIEARIASLLNEANLKAAALRAEHGVSAIKAKLQADLAAAKDLYEKHVELLKAEADAKVKAAQAVLPPLVLPSTPVPSA
jgi:hypothetical protein